MKNFVHRSVYDEEGRYSSDEIGMMNRAGIIVEKPQENGEVRYIDLSHIEERRAEIRRLQEEMMKLPDVPL